MQSPRDTGTNVREPGRPGNYTDEKGPYPAKGPRTYLATVRIEKGLTQHQLAQKIGVDRTMIVWWERGAQPLSWERARQLSKALKMSKTGPRPVATPDHVAAVLFCRQNTDVMRFKMDASENIPAATGIRLLKKMKGVLDMRPFYARQDARTLLRTYYELVDRTFRRNG